MISIMLNRYQLHQYWYNTETVGARIHSNSASVMSCYEDVMSVFYVYFMRYNDGTKLVCIA